MIQNIQITQPLANKLETIIATHAIQHNRHATGRSKRPTLENQKKLERTLLDLLA